MCDQCEKLKEEIEDLKRRQESVFRYGLKEGREKLQSDLRDLLGAEKVAE